VSKHQLKYLLHLKDQKKRLLSTLNTVSCNGIIQQFSMMNLTIKRNNSKKLLENSLKEKRKAKMKNNLQLLSLWANKLL